MIETLYGERRMNEELRTTIKRNTIHSKRLADNPELIGVPDYRSDMDRFKRELFQVIESWALWRANNETEYTFDLKGNFLN